MSIIAAGLIALGAYLLYSWLDRRRESVREGLWQEEAGVGVYAELILYVLMILAGLSLVVTP